MLLLYITTVVLNPLNDSVLTVPSPYDANRIPSELGGVLKTRALGGRFADDSAPSEGCKLNSEKLLPIRRTFKLNRLPELGSPVVPDQEASLKPRQLLSSIITGMASV
jgi:hypothetical protein